MTTSLDMIRGRSNVVTLINNSGGALVAGDVCVQDTTADEKATTTTSAADTKKIFVAAESIASGASGRFYESGYCPLVNVNASVTRGRFLFTHTVAKQAAESATYGAGAFGKILKSGTTPSAIIYSQTAQISSGIGGATGSTDNAVIRADGTGGSTVQSSLATVDDSGTMNIPTGQTYNINNSPHTHAGGSGFPATITTPALGDFAWVNQGGATGTSLSYGIEILAPVGAGNNIRLLKKAAPVSTPYTISVGFTAFLAAANYSYCGVGWRQSSDGKLVLAGPGYGDGHKIRILKYDSATAYNSAYTDIAVTSVTNFYFWFMRLSDDGANRKILVSPDSRNWGEIHSVGRTDFLTADEVFFFVESNNASNTAAITAFSWIAA